MHTLSIDDLNNNALCPFAVPIVDAHVLLTSAESSPHRLRTKPHCQKSLDVCYEKGQHNR